MSEAVERPGFCPSCGNPTPAGARFCPTCGATLSSEPPSGEWFRDAIDDVVTDETQPATPPPVTPVDRAAGGAAPSGTLLAAGESAPGGWTATPGEWSSPPPASISTSEPTGWRRNRTMWIILGIVGFIVFCCCGSLMLVSAVSSNGAGLPTDLAVALAGLARA